MGCRIVKGRSSLLVKHTEQHPLEILRGGWQTFVVTQKDGERQTQVIS